MSDTNNKSKNFQNNNQGSKDSRETTDSNTSRGVSSTDQQQNKDRLARGSESSRRDDESSEGRSSSQSQNSRTDR